MALCRRDIAKAADELRTGEPISIVDLGVNAGEMDEMWVRDPHGVRIVLL
ncbi:hypothetical protein [Kibdelosporangium aridum]|nr:hypothetical protein [Kibdelosporangium aridum]